LALTPSIGTLLPRQPDSVNWDSTKNLMIEGDNLEVLKLLQKSYSGKIKLIYIDPPYNTGRDFVYPDNFQDNIKNYLEITGQLEGGKKLSSNTESSGRFHTDWLNMMFPRLKLARNLLRSDGVIFISIGESELQNLICLCDLVFGPECSVGIACRVAKKSNNKGDHWAPNFDYIVTYAKDKETVSPFSGGVNTAAYDQIENDGPRKGERYQLVRLYMSTIENQNPEQRFWIDCPDGSKIIPPGDTFPPERPKLGDGIWRWSRKKFEEERDRIVVREVRSSNLLNQDKQPAKWNVFTKTYLSDVIENATSKPNNLIEDHINQIGSHEMTALSIPFDYPKPSTLISYLCAISQSKDDDIIMDFFAGSGTTGHAVMAQNVTDGSNRRFILVQLPEQLDPEDAKQKDAVEFCDKLGKPRNISELTKERLRRAGKKIKTENPMFAGDIGFRVFKLDSSNIRAWEPNQDDLKGSLLATVEHIHEGRTEDDILFELLLKLGLDLTVPLEQRVIQGKRVHSIGGGVLMVCLDTAVGTKEYEALALGIAAWHKELAPAGETTLVFRDSAFVDDVAKTNLTAILSQHGLDNIRSL
jgi:adenine-specific DNA-methyltransferase